MKEYRGKNYMTIKELADYLPDQPMVSTVYVWVNQGKIPYEKFGKKVMFEQSEIDQWNDKNRPVNS